MEKGKLERFSVSISGSLGLNSQSLLLAINPQQSMRSGFISFFFFFYHSMLEQPSEHVRLFLYLSSLKRKRKKKWMEVNKLLFSHHGPQG